MKVFLHLKAKKVLEKLYKTVREQIKNKLKELENYPTRGKHLKHCEFRSLRTDDYRAIYEIDGKQHKITVLFIGRRKDVYDDFSKLF